MFWFLRVILDDEKGIETERILLDPLKGNYGFVIPQGVWHAVDVLSPCVIYEAKDGKYGEDGTENFSDYQVRLSTNHRNCFVANSLGDLAKNIEYLIGMERQSGSMEAISPLYVSRMLNVPLKEVEKTMEEMNL